MEKRKPTIGLFMNARERGILDAVVKHFNDNADEHITRSRTIREVIKEYYYKNCNEGGAGDERDGNRCI